MCGRIAVESDTTYILKRFNATPHVLFEWREAKKRDDVSPGREIPIIRQMKAHMALDQVLWGWWFFKKGASGKTVKQLIINSREDTILRDLDNPSKVYKEGLSGRRVLIPATAFYEWREEGGKKVKYKISIPGEKMFALGGFEVFCKNENQAFVSTVTIITTEPTPQMEEFHNRMPLILSTTDEQSWIENKESGREYLKSIFERNKMSLEISMA